MNRQKISGGVTNIIFLEQKIKYRIGISLRLTRGRAGFFNLLEIKFEVLKLDLYDSLSDLWFAQGGFSKKFSKNMSTFVPSKPVILTTNSALRKDDRRKKDMLFMKNGRREYSSISLRELFKFFRKKFENLLALFYILAV